MKHPDRISQLKQRLRRRKLDAFLVSQPENRRYLSGYSSADHDISETSGLLLIPARGKPLLLTDFRFREQAEREAEGFEIVLYPKGVFALLKKLLPDLRIGTLGFESHYTLHSTAEKLAALGESLRVRTVPLTGLVEQMRVVKSADEIEYIRQSVQLNEQVFQEVQPTVSPGEAEVAVALRIASQMRLRGAERESFDTIVAAGAASSLPHAVPGQKMIEKNAMVLIDMGLVLNGYCSDMTRTFFLGKPDSRYRKIHRVVRKAQLAGLAAVRSGVTGKEVDQAARRVIVDSGYGKYFGHALGHGVGLAVHEEPRVSPKGTKKLRAGMVITLEPGIYIPGWGGIRLEDMVVVTDGGCENLNRDTTWLDL